MRVVVVDPSRTVLKAVSRLLAVDGHEAITFIDGPEAISYIKSDPSVVALIASAELTTMSGVELCWETRLLSGRDRAIYIILMSSNSDQRHLINALDSGADEFIGKPPVKEELFARLRSAERLIRLQRELIRLAMIDPLTGLFNRRAFFEKAQQAIARASASSRPAAIMFDVDHFKRVNDTYGHGIGDQVLRDIAHEAASERMVVGRLGGEEFAILLEASNLAAGIKLAEGLRARVAALAFDTELGKLTLTCSFGVSEWEHEESIDQLLKRADAALYEAKTGGRNRVMAAGPSALRTDAAQGSGVVRSASRGATARQDQATAASHPGGPLPSRTPDLAPAVSSLPTSAKDGWSYPASAYVLDDDPRIAALVCKVLGACGIVAREFTSPEPFLAELGDSPPELVVLDLSLGQSDAVEIIRHLEILKYKGKVLLISGRDETTLVEIAHIGERHGLRMLTPLRKPFRPADLRQRLAAPQRDTRPAAVEPLPDCKTPEGAPFRLVDALHNNWLEVWYQPKIDLKSLSVCGAEALVRARHPSFGVCTPANLLLPPAGDPAIEPLSKFVIEQAMADWGRFADQGLQLRLSVNMPISVISTLNFIPMVRSLLPTNASFPGLTIEITEDEIIRDPKSAREIASQLTLYNVGISIDDFGSAYASLSRLNDLPFIEVKIDRSFVAGCSSDRLKHELCQTVVELAHRFGATACAEGVETPEDLRELFNMQCDTAQGLLFAEPMPASELAATLLTRIGSSAATFAAKPLVRAQIEESGSERAPLAQVS
jgi:two-component system, cell cycle response regulator